MVESQLFHISYSTDTELCYNQPNTGAAYVWVIFGMKLHASQRDQHVSRGKTVELIFSVQRLVSQTRSQIHVIQLRF